MIGRQISSSSVVVIYLSSQVMFLFILASVCLLWYLQNGESEMGDESVFVIVMVCRLCLLTRAKPVWSSRSWHGKSLRIIWYLPVLRYSSLSSVCSWMKAWAHFGDYSSSDLLSTVLVVLSWACGLVLLFSRMCRTEEYLYCPLCLEILASGQRDATSIRFKVDIRYKIFGCEEWLAGFLMRRNA